MADELPHRQLRNGCGIEPLNAPYELPHRQLRKKGSAKS